MRPTNPMAITDAPKCQHRHEDGARCQRPARRRLRLCDFHLREHKRNARRTAERARQRWFESVALDKPKSIQKALAQIIQRLSRREIDPKPAGQLLYKLQMASVRLYTASSRNDPVFPSGDSRTSSAQSSPSPYTFAALQESPRCHPPADSSPQSPPTCAPPPTRCH